MADAANDGLGYPATFQDFMAVVSRWERARHYTSVRPGTGIGDALQQTAHELDDALAIFRQVWAHAEAGRTQPAEVTEEMKRTGVREMFLVEPRTQAEAWEEKLARVYIAMRNAGVGGKS